MFSKKFNKVLVLFHRLRLYCNHFLNRSHDMATKIQKSKFLSLRVTPRTHKAFITKAKQFGGTSEVLDELVTAFLEDRLTITPPTNRKESLYHVA